MEPPSVTAVVPATIATLALSSSVTSTVRAPLRIAVAVLLTLSRLPGKLSSEASTRLSSTAATLMSKVGAATGRHHEGDTGRRVVGMSGRQVGRHRYRQGRAGIAAERQGHRHQGLDPPSVTAVVPATIATLASRHR